MPIYQYQCSSCEVLFECFETMDENAANGDPHCPKCDPEQKEDPTCFKYMGNCKPMITLGGPPGRGWTPGSF